MVQGSIFKDRAICAKKMSSYFDYTVGYERSWCDGTIFPEFIDDKFQRCINDYFPIES